MIKWQSDSDRIYCQRRFYYIDIIDGASLAAYANQRAIVSYLSAVVCVRQQTTAVAITMWARASLTLDVCLQLLPIHRYPHTRARVGVGVRVRTARVCGSGRVQRHLVHIDFSLARSLKLPMLALRRGSFLNRVKNSRQNKHRCDGLLSLIAYYRGSEKPN